jgi:hypothetical protein
MAQTTARPGDPRAGKKIVQQFCARCHNYFLARLTFKQIYDVASFVAKYAGKPAPKRVSGVRPAERTTTG